MAPPSTSSGNSPHSDSFLRRILRGDHNDNTPTAPAAARKQEKLYGDMVETSPSRKHGKMYGEMGEEEKLISGKSAWRDRGTNLKAQHKPARKLTGKQLDKVKRAKEKRAAAQLEKAGKDEKVDDGGDRLVELALQEAAPEAPKKVEVKKVDEVPESWEDEMEG